MRPANSRWFLLKVALCLGLLFIAAGCDDEDWHHDTGTLRLHNRCSVTIDYFNLTPANHTSWGGNLLPAPLPADHWADIRDISPGVYDARATVVGVFSTYWGYSYDLRIREDFISDLYADESSFTGSLKIINGTAGASIVALYVVPSSASSWGPNQIDSPIGPSGSIHLDDMTPDRYDVRVVWNVGPDSIYGDIPVDSLTLTTQTAN